MEITVLFLTIDSIPTITGRSSSSDAVAAVFAVLTVAVIAAVSAVAVILIVLRRKAKQTTITAVQYTNNDSEGVKEIGNPTYTSGMRDTYNYTVI